MSEGRWCPVITAEDVGLLAMISSMVIIIVGLPAQIYLNYIRKSTKGLSVVLMISGCWSYCVWALYGFYKMDKFILYAQAPGFFLGLILILQIFYYKRFGAKRVCGCDCHS